MPHFHVALLKIYKLTSDAAGAKKESQELKTIDEDLGKSRNFGFYVNSCSLNEMVPVYTPKIGDTIDALDTPSIVIDTTVNLFDTYYGIRHGVIEEIWPILARGKVH